MACGREEGGDRGVAGVRRGGEASEAGGPMIEDRANEKRSTGPAAPAVSAGPALRSVNVGLPRLVEWKGRVIQTSIWKAPVEGPVRVREHNLDGDRQSDLSVHGGPAKAVYVYPSEHYPWWRTELGDDSLAWGGFGENFTIEGLLEEDVNIGDRIRIGTAELIVTQPRTPCFKLGIRFGRDDIIKRFFHSGRSGFYLAVAREGEVRAGDAIEFMERAVNSSSIAEVARRMGDNLAGLPHRR